MERMLAALGNGVQRDESLFRGYGLFTRIAICGLASQSRWGNHQLESRVRENRTHGSEGGNGESRLRPLSPLRQISSPSLIPRSLLRIIHLSLMQTGSFAMLANDRV